MLKIDQRFLKESGPEIFTGNELLVKGALETPGGVHLFTGYPGSPIAPFFDTLENIGPLLKEKGMVAKLANNEALSAAMVNGSQMAECRAMVAMKNVGLHVASDALALGVLAGTKGDGGAIVVCGDDPWSDSTQVPADSRFLAEHMRMPMLEPSGPQEVKDWIAHAFELCKAGQIYIGYMMTVNNADGGGSVEVKKNYYPELNTHQKRLLSYEKDIKDNLDQFVLLPPRTWKRELTLEHRFEMVNQKARQLGLNKIIGKPADGQKSPVGFVACGTSYSYLVHALCEMGLDQKIPILKIGLSYPLDKQIVSEFAECCEDMIVIEERRSFLEKQIHEILATQIQNQTLRTKVWGKKLPDGLKGIPETRGLNPSILIERLAPYFQKHPAYQAEDIQKCLQEEMALRKETTSVQINIPARTPTFCPGCPHRDSSSVLLELRKDLRNPDYMKKHYNRKPVDLVAHGDTGCYTMYMFEPTIPLMHNYSGMGLGGGTGGGIDPFIDNKQLVFLGDGTFFHSGQVAISQSIASGQDITYFILDNKTTAMTGHQTHAGVETDLVGNPQMALEIETIVKGMVPEHIKSDVMIARLNPADRESYRKTAEKAIMADGVKIVIADKECGITFHRRRKREENKIISKQGYLNVKTHMNVATEVCENCLECTTQTGCPGLTITDTDYGPKIQTDFSWCVNDGACHRIGACPSFEEVTILRKQPPRWGDEHVDLADIPEPQLLHEGNDSWRCYMTGVGGMGIGICNKILVTAGHQMGYKVQFLDKKGLAIRNGGVYSQVLFTKDNSIRTKTTPVISNGKADLLLGIDLLEASRAIDPKQPFSIACTERTATVINTAKTPTILTLMGQEDFNYERLEGTLKKYTHEGRYFGFNVGDLCERVLDSKLYANIMILGIAFQKGYIPVKLEIIENAIRSIIRKDTERNLRAFNIGRKIVLNPEHFVVEPTHEVETARKAFRRKINMIRNKHRGKRGKMLAKQFRVLIRQTNRATRGLRIDDKLMRDVVIRTYDCFIWGGMEYAKQYCRHLVDVFQKDDPAQGYGITRAVVWNLAKVMLIKDEVYCAALLTCPEKYKRDRRRFNVNPNVGDKIIYAHHNKPEFEILGKKIRFSWKGRDWQLRLMSKMRFLRKWMPKWHYREKDFRDWYEMLIGQLQYDGPKDYKRWQAILSVPEKVTGYREVRYPKMEKAQAKAIELLNTDPELFELAAPPTEPHMSIQEISTSKLYTPKTKSQIKPMA